jgi:asparagine synthase (glutamine-hydrolysing)
VKRLLPAVAFLFATPALAASSVPSCNLSAPDAAQSGCARALDLSYRPRKDGFESNLWVMRRVDLGNHTKGTLGGWGIDQRDPTTDRRLIEFCLGVPEEQFLVNGETKALARRAFAVRVAPEVIHLRGNGYQAVNWHEGLSAAPASAHDEIGRLADCGPAATALDLPRPRRLAENLLESGWEKREVMEHFRLALLRGIATGHFLRRATGSNA